MYIRKEVFGQRLVNLSSSNHLAFFQFKSNLDLIRAQRIVLAKICPTRIHEFVWPEKIGWGREFFVWVLNPEITSFHIRIVPTQFWPEFSFIWIVRPEKSGYRSSIFCLNFDIVQFVWPEFDPNSNFCQR